MTSSSYCYSITPTPKNKTWSTVSPCLPSLALVSVSVSLSLFPGQLCLSCHAHAYGSMCLKQLQLNRYHCSSGRAETFLLVVAARLILHVGNQLRLAQPDGRYRPECTVYIRKIRIVANVLWTYSSKRDELLSFLANVNSRSRSLYAIARPSVVCNARAPYSGGSNFPQYFYGIWYLGHPLTSTENFREPLRQGS